MCPAWQYALCSRDETQNRYLLNTKETRKYATTYKGNHTHTQLFYGSLDFVRDNPGEPIPEETFTHSHLSWSSIVLYLLHPSNTIHGVLPVQSMHLTVFLHNLSPSFLRSTCWTGTLHFILHTFLHPIMLLSSKSQQMVHPSIHPWYSAV